MDRPLVLALSIAAAAHLAIVAAMRVPVAAPATVNVSATMTVPPVTVTEMVIDPFALADLAPSSSLDSPPIATANSTSNSPAMAIATRTIATTTLARSTAPGIGTTKAIGERAGATEVTSIAGEPPSVPTTNATAPTTPKSPAFPSLIDGPGKHGLILPKAEVPSKNASLASKLDDHLKQTLDDRDREIGVGVGGEVVTAAHTAAQGSSGPLGTATLEVQTDAAGKIIVVRVGDTSESRVAWEEVARTLKAELAGHALKVPTGANGVVVRIAVEAAMKFPSGATQAITPIPGGIAFDVVDIGAKKRRVVAVRIVDTRRL